MYSTLALFALALAQNTTYTKLTTIVETITHCEETVTDCPARNGSHAVVTRTETITVIDCPTGNVTIGPSSHPNATLAPLPPAETTLPHPAPEANAAAVVGVAGALIAGALLL